MEKIEENLNVYYRHVRTELLPYVPENCKKVLDVGCSNGAFGQLLKKQFGFEIWGVEPFADAGAEAKKRLDKFFPGTFDEVLNHLPLGQFDLICFNDVLEHMVKPDETLRQCLPLLSKNGKILASIPNIRWYPVVLQLIRYKDFKYQDVGVMDRTHLRFFTQKSMRQMFNDCGYNVSLIAGINKSTTFRMLNILNTLLLNTQEDMKFPQFVIVAEAKNND